MAGHDRHPDLQRALEMVRRSAAALKAGEIEAAKILLREAEQSLVSFEAQSRGYLSLPGITHPVLYQAAIETIGALERANAALGTTESEVRGPGPDSLTGLANARAFQEHLAELAQTVPATETCWLLLADVDRFRVVNDEYGHLVGDEYLKALAAALRTNVSTPHLAARVGGDEFAVALRDLSLVQARLLAESLCTAVEELDHPVRATLSIGLAGWLPASEPFEEAFRRGDHALWQAKAAGGSRVHVSGIDDDPDFGFAVARG